MVEFKSKLDSNKSIALQKHTFKRGVLVFLFLSAIFVAAGIIMLVLNLESGDIILSIVLIAIGALFTPLCYIISIASQKSYNKSTVYISSETEEIYTFDEQYITITHTRGDEYFGTTKAKYSYIYMAYEDKNYYYLQISTMQSHIIDKSSITQGTLEEMNTLLKTRLGDKFKSKQK